MIQILHNVSCSKSNAAVEMVSENNISCTIRNFIENPLNAEEIKEVIKKLNRPVMDIVRTNEEIYQTKFAHKTMTENEIINMLVENPILLQRPIIIKDDKAIIGRPSHLIDEFLQEK
jgi:arsenate reductase